MTTQPSPDDSAWEAKLRRAGLTSFLVATAASSAFFAFFPGLPHVIDWGAIITSLAIGGLARWARQSHLSKRHATHRADRTPRP